MMEKSKKIRIYTSMDYLFPNQKHTFLLNPYWGDSDVDGEEDYGRFSDYSSKGRGLFDITKLEEAQVIVCPGEWRADNPKILELYNIACERNLPFIIFFNNDSDEAIFLDKTIIFRTSLFRSKRKKNEFAFPAWSVDFIKNYNDGKLRLKTKTALPVVAYTGYIDYANLGGMIEFGLKRIMARNKNSYIGAELRGKAIRKMASDHRLNCKFIFRNGFLGGCASDLRREYAENMLSADYVLVARGAGNFSYRFYETLSCGKIPVFLDTDCALPFDDMINWHDYCVWIDAKEVSRIGDRIVEFHESISEKKFIDLQKNIRALYEEWISPYGFYKNALDMIFKRYVIPL